jgi:nucleoside-diphosphate kinase
MGATNHLDAAPGTIRADLAMHLTYNLIHGSDSPKTAQREIELFFQSDDVVSYPDPGHVIQFV